jgi:hypothetical protein
MSTPDGERFDARSPVGRYWLLHGVGFTVKGPDGRTLGVVDDVLSDSVRQRAQRVTLRRPGLGRLLGRTTLLPSVVETVVPESKLFIVGAAQSAVRVPARRAKRRREVITRVRAALTWVAAALARAGAALRPAASWSRRHSAAALGLAADRARRGAHASARASAAAAARTRREAPRLAAWLAARSRSSSRATARSLRFLGAATRVATARTAAGTRVAAARTAAGTRVASSHLAAWARTTARALGDLTVLVAVFVSDTWRKAAAAQTPPPEDDTQETVRPELEPQSDLDAPLARDATAKRPRRPAAARSSSRKPRT